MWRFRSLAVALGFFVLTGFSALAQVELGPPKSTHFWPGSLRVVDWLPDGDEIVVTSVHGVHFRNLATKEITKTFPLVGDMIPSAAITDDGKTLFTLQTGDLRQWDVATTTVTREVEVQPGYESRIAVARDSDLLAVPSSTSGQIDLRKKSDLTLIRTLVTGRGDAGAVELSADGSTLAATFGYYSVVVYDVSTGATLWQGGIPYLQPCFLSPDGSALFFADQKIELPAGTMSTIPHGAGRRIAGLSRDGRTASLLLPQTTNSPAAISAVIAMSAVNLESGDLLWDSEIQVGVGVGLGLVKFSSDGKSLLTGGSGQIIVLDAATGIVNSRDFAPTAYGVLSSDASKLICPFVDGSVRIWDVASETQDQGYALFSSAYYLLRLEPFPPIRERVKTGSSATACSTNR